MKARPVQLAILAAVAVSIAALLVWSATSGPGQVVGTMHRTADSPAVEPSSMPSASPTPADPTRTSRPHQSRHATPVKRSSWLGDVLAVLLFGGALWLLVAVGRTLLQRITYDAGEERAVVELEALPDPEVARAALQRDRERQFAALDGTDLRNGIVECWVLLEEAAAQAGLPRRASETPTEFVVRFLRGLDVDPRPVARLAELYHEARFSSHTLAPDARGRAEAALAAIHADLAVTQVVS